MKKTDKKTTIQDITTTDIDSAKSVAAGNDDGASSTLAVTGARVHNLKNIDVEIPHGQLTVITGLSGSGKSSLAFDTIYAEGQRRYIETFSSYARGMMGALERPDVDSITGLCPVIAIEQKTVNKNPRSTIGTTTEIYDFLRLLYARAATAVSYLTGKPMVKYSREAILAAIMEKYDGCKLYLLAPLVLNRKGHYKELFENLTKKGYINVRVDGEFMEITPGLKLDRYRNHTIELVVDKLKVSERDADRLRQSIDKSLDMGDKEMMLYDPQQDKSYRYSLTLMDPETGLAYREPAPHNFSFNSPLGACPCCKGLGTVNVIDREKLIPDASLSIAQGAIVPLGKARNTVIFSQIESLLSRNGLSLKTPVKDIPESVLDEILNGTDSRLEVSSNVTGVGSYFASYEGILKFIEMQHDEDADQAAQKWSGQFFSTKVCPECNGDRLNKEALHYFLLDKNIAQLCRMDIGELHEWISGLEAKLPPRSATIAHEVLKEITSRLGFLIDVGLEYLSLGRMTATLSGGESQRIRLATQIGSELVNVMYILDEPSIGLHQSDNKRLIGSLKKLRDASNTVIVVEHDQEMMEEADYIVDIGPGAGRRGGEVVFQGKPGDMLKADTLTSRFLNGKEAIELPSQRRTGCGKTLSLKGASGNNLKNVDLEIPLGTFTCIAGVSGSGKSSLVNGTLQPVLSAHFYRSTAQALPYRAIEGIEHIDKVVTVDQSPIGRTPRSNPATYTGVFGEIRSLFASLPEAKIRGYKPGRFSFNVAGGRCETCSGNGYKTIAMNFLPDVLVPCETCGGKRYNRETLEVRFKGRSIADVLDMTINQAVEFFANQPSILRKIKVLQEIGLGYIKLGQPSSTLSGGENQRVKLATELARRDTGKTLFILDEPTTGLHFKDIKTLLGVIEYLVSRGNTVLCIEHNLDVLKMADHIIDMGPGGGRDGGRIIAVGTPEEIAKTGSPTSSYLASVLKTSPVNDAADKPVAKPRRKSKKVTK